MRRFLTMPFFESDDAGGTGSANNTGDNSNTENTDNKGDKGDNNEDSRAKNDDKLDRNTERLLQARLDKAMAEERKKNASLTKEIEKMKREKMTADELKKYDDEKRTNQLAEREKAILDKENRYYAIGAIKKAGLDDGSDTALKIVDLVMGNDSDEIDKKVSALNELVNKIVDVKVNAKFKANGRTPSGGVGVNGEDKGKNTLAERLGRIKSEQAKKSNDILKHYI